jgi:hypothetical protein
MLPFWSFGPHACSASGYIGSLLVEQLLRTTDVKRIYVLFRGKRGSPAKERLLRILHSGLFHLVRDDNTLLSKVRVAQALPAAPLGSTGRTPQHRSGLCEVAPNKWCIFNAPLRACLPWLPHWSHESVHEWAAVTLHPDSDQTSDREGGTPHLSFEGQGEGSIRQTA